MKHCLPLFSVGIFFVGITVALSNSRPDSLQKTISHTDTQFDVSEN